MSAEQKRASLYFQDMLLAFLSKEISFVKERYGLAIDTVLVSCEHKGEDINVKLELKIGFWKKRTH